MNFSDILLIIVSGAGLLHGFAFALYLFFFKKKKTITNYILASILVFMAFRIGKSVMLNFGDDLEPLFIFIGLSFLLLIGPLLRWYVNGMTEVDFKLSRYNYLELIPFLVLFSASLLVNKNWFESSNKEVIIVFASALIFIYLHLAFYIFGASRILKKVTDRHSKDTQTKSQIIVLKWLKLLIIGFVIIWISYVLNIIDGAIPYITGPILYSLVVYFLSFKGFQLKVTDLDGKVFKKNDNTLVFNKLSKLIVDKALYLNANLSLTNLSILINRSPQKTSEIINQNAKQNFNDFINHFRINDAKKLLLANKNITIASVAFDSGFNSLSSFNTAFKKNEGITPSVYRKRGL